MIFQKEKTFSIFLSFLAGVLLALIMQINANLGQRIGPLESSFVAHLIGSVFALFFMTNKLNKDFFQSLRKVPKFLFTCGIYGVLLVLASNIIVPKLGMVLAAGITITFNLLFSVIFDHFGCWGLPVFKINFKRFLGVAVSLIGLYLVLLG